MQPPFNVDSISLFCSFLKHWVIFKSKQVIIAWIIHHVPCFYLLSYCSQLSLIIGMLTVPQYTFVTKNVLN